MPLLFNFLVPRDYQYRLAKDYKTNSKLLVTNFLATLTKVHDFEFAS